MAALDTGRMRQPPGRLRGSVQGLLVPGSTGDGWQLSDAEVRELLGFLLPEARARGMAVLIGVLKADTAEPCWRACATPPPGCAG